MSGGSLPKEQKQVESLGLLAVEQRNTGEAGLSLQMSPEAEQEKSLE